MDDDAATVRRYDKRTSAATTPCALGWIREVYPDAIAYRTVPGGLRGLGFVLVIALAAPFVTMLVGYAVIGWTDLPFENWRVAVDCLPLLAAVVLVMAAGIALLARCFGIGFCAPEDLPIIFDRKHRKVYRMLLENAGSMFRRPSIFACEYEWDLVDAEHRHYQDEHSDADRSHVLMFVVRKRHDAATVIDRFAFPAGGIEKTQVAAAWEHIRRFMQEDGPHVPTRDEPLARPAAPVSWWGGLHAVGVFERPYFMTHWRIRPLFALISLPLLPLSLSLQLLWGTGHYLSAKKAIPVRWPRIVVERIGLPLSGDIVERAAA